MKDMKIVRKYFLIVLVVFITTVEKVYSIELETGICNETSLNDARKKYELGKFTEVVNSLSSCVNQNGFKKRQEVLTAYRLLALSYFAQDSLERAIENVNKLLVIFPEYESNLFDPPRFIKMINEIKVGVLVGQITSASKKAENVLKTPATVVVVSGDEIRTRGYTDLVELLADVPGFDISRHFGANYANIYQRGFRQNNTERTLFLIDGVEQNDLWVNSIYLSRQYPLSNIKQVEIVYGPNSTLYGANAFVGVVNIITKTPIEFLDKGRNIGINAKYARGSYNANEFEATVAGRVKNISFSVTGRYYESDEMDLSFDEQYNYSEDDFDTFNYAANLNGSVNSNDALYTRLVDSNGVMSQAYFNVIPIVGDSANFLIELTDEGRKKAATLDKQLYADSINNNPVGFSNPTQDFYLNAKLSIGRDFSIGFEKWTNIEGGNTFFNDFNEAGANNGSLWNPTQTMFSLNYNKKLAETVTIHSLTSYRISSFNSKTRAVFLDTYANGVLGAGDLLNDVPGGFFELGYYQLSRQLRSEMRFIYNLDSKLDLISGIEVRSSSLQGNYINASIYDGINLDSPNWFDSIAVNNDGGNQYNSFNFGVYTQATYKFKENLDFVLGGRFDYNKIRQDLGFGWKFNPRIAAIYSPNKFVFKAIYSSGIQNVSQWTKFSESGSRNPNPDLETEQISNFDLSASWKRDKNLLFTLVGYYSQISDAIALAPDPNAVGKNWHEHLFQYQIMGLQNTVKYTFLDANVVNFNLTYTHPFDVSSDTKKLRVADIASFNFNVGYTRKLFDRLNVNVRGNFVGERPVGEGTTVPTNTFEFPSHLIVNSALTYNFPLSNKKNVSDISFQFVINNLFNTKYNDPGPRDAGNGIFVSHVPQRFRNFIARILFNF
jgi:outer membrane receptor protein involved in Fe transport